MKRKSARRVAISRGSFRFDSAEFLLLVFVAVVMLAYFGIQTGLLPKFFTDSILGVTTVR